MEKHIIITDNANNSNTNNGGPRNPRSREEVMNRALAAAKQAISIAQNRDDIRDELDFHIRMANKIRRKLEAMDEEFGRKVCEFRKLLANLK